MEGIEALGRRDKKITCKKLMKRQPCATFSCVKVDVDESQSAFPVDNLFSCETSYSSIPSALMYRYKARLTPPRLQFRPCELSELLFSLVTLGSFVYPKEVMKN